MTKTTKIGIATMLSYGGAQPTNVLNNNDGPWKDKVGDIRRFLKYFDGIDQHEHHVTILTFSADGCYLTLLASNGGRGDFKSVWIYLPNDIILSDDDIWEIYSYATSYLFDPQGKRDRSEEQIIYKDFGTKEHPIAYAPSAVPGQGQRPDEKLAVRYYCSDHTNNNLPTLKELIGRKIYQESYSRYERVFLLPQDGAVTINPGDAYRFKDISHETLLTYTIIIPPTTDELNALGNGTRIVFNDDPFAAPRRVVSNTYDITLSRQGFNDVTIKKTVHRDKGEEKIEIHKSEVVWKKPITADMFCDEDGNKLSGCEITVNDKDLTKTNVVLTEKECTSARVKVTKKGYDTYNGTHNLLTVGKHTITLYPETRSLTCKIRLHNGKTADITLQSRYLPESTEESPIKGYEFPMESHRQGRKVVEKVSDTLELSSSFIFKKRAEGFLAAAAIAIVIWCAIGIHHWAYEHTLTRNGIWPYIHIEKVGSSNSSSYSASPSGGTDGTAQDGTQKADDNNEASEKVEDPVVTESNDSISSTQDTQPPVSSDEAAMNYLKNNSKWTKDELEKYPLTKGLYQEMINYNFKAILNRDKSLLNVTGLKEFCDTLKDVSVGDNKYHDDGTITVESWKNEAKKLKDKKPTQP